jgi:soluble lytic murein transglycosylase
MTTGTYRAPKRQRRPATQAGAGGPRRDGRRSRRIIRRVAGLILLGIVLALVVPRLVTVIHHLLLPLADVGLIREQAAEKHLDPALIAAVIYAETKFSPRTSPAGAEGLMQIEPATARYLAHLSGGYAFKTSDLASPSVNVAYGTYYLRYLLDHYGGNEMLALAAYNAGLSNVDAWVAAARAEGHQLTVQEIPFPQTRAYVQKVMNAQRDYRDTYPQQLGPG